MKRPLLPVALCYAVGLLLGDRAQPSLAWLFAVSFALLTLGLVWPRGRVFLLWPLLTLVAWTNFVVHTAVLSPHDLRRLAGESPELVSVRGILAETPNVRMHENDERMSLRTLATLHVTALARNSEWQTAGGKILVSTTGTLPEEFFSGREVEIIGVLSPPPLPVARGLFDYRAYLIRQGIYYQLRSQGSSDWRLTQTNSPSRPLADRFLAWSQRTLARGLPEQDEPLRLTWAMTLGWKTALTDEVSEPFMRSGTMHIFAISGLHIALIAGILVGLLRVARVPRMACGAVVIPLIWFYTMATGWQSSAIRSTVMMTIIVGGWALRRPTDLLNSLAAAALIILVWDPQQLFQASFQLSFFVVLSIALFLPPLEKWRDRLLQVDPMLPPELLPRWKRIGRSGLRWVATGFATSLAAWLGSLPLSANYFHLFSPVTLLANLVVVPMSSAALACNLGSLVCGGWFPWATELFNHCGWFWMLAMLEVSRWCAALPGAYFHVPSPSLLTTMLYYGLLIGTLSGWLWQRERRARTFAALALVAVFYGWQWNQSRRETELTVLPLSGGHGVFVDSAGRSNDLLIDCGSINEAEFVTTPFLCTRGVNHLPQLLLTHGDLRHIGGAELVTDEFNTGAILTSSVRFRSPTYRRLTERFGNDPDRLITVNSGDTFGPWQVLHPKIQDKFQQADDGAVVLLGTFHGTRVLLLSDLGRPGQNALLENNRDLRADIVISGLPAQGEPLSDALLAAVEPKLIVVADSEFPATERTSGKLLQRLESQNAPVLYMRKTGALEFSFGPRGWKVIEASDTMHSFSGDKRTQ